MGKTFKKIGLLYPNNDSRIQHELEKLDGHVIFSKNKHDYRYNIEDLHHKKHNTTKKTKDGKEVSCKKEWAFGHIVLINGDYFISRRVTPNEYVEEHEVLKLIYESMTTTESYDIDRYIKRIDYASAKLIVSAILNLNSQGLIP